MAIKKISTTRKALGVCNDLNVKRAFESYRKGIVKAGDEIMMDGKSYSVAGSSVTTKAKKLLGDVRKDYRLHNDGNWYLHDRNVVNTRGQYGRRINTLMGKTDEIVSLGGKQEFVRQEDGSYLQKTNGNFPARIVSAESIESAIDYIKGKGAETSYKDLLKNLYR